VCVRVCVCVCACVCALALRFHVCLLCVSDLLGCMTVLSFLAHVSILYCLAGASEMNSVAPCMSHPLIHSSSMCVHSCMHACMHAHLLIQQSIEQSVQAVISFFQVCVTALLSSLSPCLLQEMWLPLSFLFFSFLFLPIKWIRVTCGLRLFRNFRPRLCMRANAHCMHKERGSVLKRII